MTNDQFSLISPHSQPQLLIGTTIEFPRVDAFASNLVLAQHLDPNKYDVLGDMQKSFKHFVDSGQVWALLIGIFVGYMFKGLTST